MLPNEGGLRLVSFTPELTCERKGTGHECTRMVSIATSNVSLHTTRSKVRSVLFHLSQCSTYGHEVNYTVRTPKNWISFNNDWRIDSLICSDYNLTAVNLKPITKLSHLTLKTGAHANIVVSTSKETKDCRFNFGGTRFNPHRRAEAGNCDHWIVPTHTLIFTISLGEMTTFYFVRVRLQTENISTFKFSILMVGHIWQLKS